MCTELAFTLIPHPNFASWYEPPVNIADLKAIALWNEGNWYEEGVYIPFVEDDNLN
jgi:hypothetical protein